MGSAKIIMTLWVIWKKPITSLIELDPEDAKNAQELDDGIVDNYIRVEMSFNSLMTEFFEGSDINDLYSVCLHTSRDKLKLLNFLRVAFHRIK